MAYFKSNESYPDETYDPQDPEEDYDDGFDELYEEEEPEISDDEHAEKVRNRVLLARGAGNLFGIIFGTILILILLALVFSMIYFVINDMNRNFSLFSTNF